MEVHIIDGMHHLRSQDFPCGSSRGTWLLPAVCVAICALLGLILFLADVYDYSGGDPDGLDGPAENLAAALTALDFWAGALAVSCLPTALCGLRDDRRTWVLATVPVIAALAICSGLAAPSALVVLTLAVAGGYRAPAGIGLVVLSIGGTAWALVTRREGDPGPISSVVFFLVIDLLIILCGLWLGSRRAARTTLEKLAALNREQAAALAQHAREAERTRIARELHDSIAHRLSMISLHAGVLEVDADRAETTVRAEAALIGESARLAVDDLHSVLTVLREEPVGSTVSPDSDLSALFAQARSAGQQVRCERSEESLSEFVSHLPEVVAHTVHRFVQEGLTNARKYGTGHQVTVTVFKERRNLRLSVSNPAYEDSDSGTSDTAQGYGLIGLRERVELLGGQFQVTPGTADEPTFTMSAVIPVAVSR